MAAQTISFEASADSVAALDAMATELHTDREVVLRDSLLMYAAYHEAVKAKIARGVEDVRAGRTKSHAEVVALVASWGKKAEAA